MKKTILIDDERLARSELKKLLADFSEIKIIGEAKNATEGIHKINELHPDLIFLDIQMPDKTGFELLEDLDKTPQVIFTTAYDEYAIKAFEFNALDYLLKPIEPARLKAAISRLDKEPQNKEGQDQDRSKLTREDQVFVKDGERYYFIRIGNVRLFESAGNYVKVYFDDKKPMTLNTLNALEERLDPHSFFRASRKHIVNLHKIKSIGSHFNGGLLLELEGGEKIEVSRRQAVIFKEKMSL